MMIILLIIIIVSPLDRRLSLVSDDPRESSFLFQRLSVSIQRFNSVCFCNSFGNLPAQFFDHPRRTESIINLFPLIYLPLEMKYQGHI